MSGAPGGPAFGRPVVGILLGGSALVLLLGLVSYRPKLGDLCDLLRRRRPGRVKDRSAVALACRVDALRGASRPPASAPSPAPGAAPEVPLDTIAQPEGIERQLIAEAMRKAGGNQSQAARVLGISRDTLRYRLKKHALEG